MILKNDIYMHKSKYYLVVDINSCSEVILVELNTNKLILLKEKIEIMEDNSCYAPINFHDNVIINEDFIDRYRDKIEENFKIVNEAFEKGLLYFNAKKDIYEVINKVADKFGINRKTVKKYIRIYLQNGRNKLCLVPAYYNCGAAGKSRVNCYSKKGRKSYNKKGDYKIVTEDDIENIKVYIDKYYTKHISKHFVYDKLIREKYSINGKQLPRESKISYSQFNYWCKKLFSPMTLKRKEVGQKDYINNFEALLHTTNEELTCIGELVEVDSSSSDVYVVSDLDSTVVLGKPLISICVDVFSKFCLGFTIGFEGESWRRSALLLKNVVENKVEFCKKYDIDISNDEWNCSQLPVSILSDNGMFNGNISDNWVEDLGITISQTPPYIARFKGNVESMHDSMQEVIKSFLVNDGAVFKENQRGEIHAKYKSSITYRTFIKIVIYTILIRNNRIMEGYKMSKEMINAKLVPTPKNIWNWCRNNNHVQLMNLSNEQVIINLLPQRSAIKSRKGIHVNKRCYVYEEVKYNKEFGVLAITKSEKITVRYDPADAGYIYVYCENEKKFLKGILTESDKMFDNISCFDIDMIRNDIKDNIINNEVDILSKSAEYKSKIEDSIVKDKKKVKEARNVTSKGKHEIYDNMDKHRSNQIELDTEENTFNITKEVNDTEFLFSQIEDDDELTVAERKLMNFYNMQGDKK